GRKTGGENLGDINGVPALFVNFHGGEKVFGDIVLDHATDLVEGCAPDGDIDATDEGWVIFVFALHDGAEEKFLLFPGRGGDDVILGVGIELGGLDKGDGRIGEVWNSFIEKICFGDHVSIKNDDDVAVGLAQGIVDVSGFGAPCC